MFPRVLGPECAPFKNIINFPAAPFSFLNPPTRVPPAFSHFSPTHPFYLSQPRAPFASRLPPTYPVVIHVFIQPVFFPLSAGTVNRLFSTHRIRTHCVSSGAFYLGSSTRGALVLLLRSHLSYLLLARTLQMEGILFSRWHR